MKSKLLVNIAPGEILDEEFLKPMSITQYRLAKDLGVLYFRMTLEFWLNLHSHYDLEQAQERLAGRLDKEVKVLAVA